MKRILLLAFAPVLWLALSMAEPAKANEATKPAPKPNIPEGAEVITLGAGCFWCIEAAFKQLDGVSSATSGYMGGTVANPPYDEMHATDGTVRPHYQPLANWIAPASYGLLLAMVIIAASVLRRPVTERAVGALLSALSIALAFTGPLGWAHHYLLPTLMFPMLLQARPSRTQMLIVTALGLGVSDVTPDKLKELGIKGGVQVDVVDGLAAAAGLRAGDIITQMNSSEVQNAKQFNDAVAKLDPKKDVAVLVRRGEASRFVIIRR